MDDEAREAQEAFMAAVLTSCEDCVLEVFADQVLVLVLSDPQMLALAEEGSRLLAQV
jgi:capsule polysaccharide export protein KpsE/RkpR